MKHIVVPTDFSKYAACALDYAIHIANQMDESIIHLVHVYSVPGATGLRAEAHQFLRRQIDEAMEAIKSKVGSSLFKQTKMKMRAIEGFPIETITNYANALEADYVVMGTQGLTGLKSIFLGSNTVGVMKQCKRPIIVVPETTKYRGFKNIALALDQDVISNSDVLEPLVTLGKQFNSKIKVMHVEPVKTLATVDAGVDIYLSDFQPTFYFVEDQDINRGINRFVEVQHIDLLCMVQRQRSFLHRLLFESVTKIEAFNSPVPLLVLHD